MAQGEVLTVDYMNLSPYVRYIHEVDWDPATGRSPDGAEALRVPPRVIYDYEIIYFAAGVGTFQLGGQEYKLRAGDLHMIPPQLENACAVPYNQYFHYYAVHFDPIYLGEHLDFSPDDIYAKVDYIHQDRIPPVEDLMRRPTFDFRGMEFAPVTHATEPYRCHQLFSDMLAAFQGRAHGFQLVLRSLLLSVISILVADSFTREGVRRAHPHAAAITRAIQFMRSHFSEDIQLNAIAASVSLSPSYFRTLFREATGKSPLEFLTDVRLEYAKKLLLDGRQSVSEVCALVGYDDIHYFSRLFKKHEGLPPKYFLGQVRQG